MLATAPAASANVLEDLNNFNLTTSYAPYTTSSGALKQFTATSPTSDPIQYRWLDAPVKETVIQGRSCFGSTVYQTKTYAVGSTSYQTIATKTQVPPGWCFTVYGRTTSGTMNLYDGRVSR